jgi:hypothetical protein
VNLAAVLDVVERLDDEERDEQNPDNGDLVRRGHAPERSLGPLRRRVNSAKPRKARGIVVAEVSSNGGNVNGMTPDGTIGRIYHSRFPH